MKKLSIILVVLSISAISFAQADSLRKPKGVDLVSKKGVNILPEKGEISIGIDAVPLFYYLGGIFSDNHASPPTFNYGNDFDGTTGILLKYMLTNDLAARVLVRANFGSSTDVNVVPESTFNYDPQSPQFVNDEITTKSHVWHIGAGIEKSRGNSRVQGKYGGEVILGYNKVDRMYNYGNSITNDFNTPATYNNVYNNGERLINDYIDQGFYAGLRGFVGLEFFIGPKISLGGEFGYSVLYQWSQNRLQEYQYWNSQEQMVSTVIRESNNVGYDDLLLNIDNLDGSIILSFYF